MPYGRALARLMEWSMTERDAQKDGVVQQASGLTTRLSRTRALVRATMIFERGWPLVLPLVIVLGLFLSLSWFGLFRVIPDMARLAILAIFALAAIASLSPL